MYDLQHRYYDQNILKYLECLTEDQEPCQCIFPFKSDGVSYDSCSDPYDEGLWCATAVDATGEYSGWGWCIEGESLLVEGGIL